MTYKEAVALKDKYSPIVIGQTFIKFDGEPLSGSPPITHLFIAPMEGFQKAFEVWASNSTLISNEECLLQTNTMDDELTVFIISYSELGDGILSFRPLRMYLNDTNQLDNYVK